MSNLLVRALSGIVIIILVTGSILLSEYTALVLMIAVFSLSFLEYNKMFRHADRILFSLNLFVGISMIAVLYLTISSTIAWHWNSVFLISAGSLIILYYLLSTGKSLSELSMSVFGMLWIAGSLVLLLSTGWLENPEAYDPLLIMVLIILIWINDIGAYVFGSMFGKNHLAPAISPGKTWEGFISGIVLTGLSGWAAYILTDSFSLIFWIATGVLISLTSTAGDLFESKMKRDTGVKDSGSFIPGHGGFLDRFDSLFFSAPFYYIILSIWTELA